MRSLIAVDIGNSSTKLGMFESAPTAALPKPAWVESVKDEMDVLAGKMPALPTQWKVVSVQREREKELEAWVRRQRPEDDYQLLTFRDLPLEVQVDRPDRVGMDRLAAAVGANVLRTSGRPAVVIDAGSAVTVDLLSADGAFAGGVILPGFRMSARALSNADLLPEVLWQTSDEPPPVLGKNTEAAIRSGLFWGAVGAVREIIARYSESHPNPQIIVTGGDLHRLVPLLGQESRFVPNLVLSGIAVACREA